MLNKVQIIGRLGADPEVRSIASGDKVANLRVAVSEKWTDRNSGEKKERTEWIPIVIWNERLVGVAEAYLRKGSRAYFEGQLQTRKWQDNQGNDRYTTEVVLSRFKGELVLLDSKSDGGDAPSQQPARQGASAPPRGKVAADDLNDEVPFAPCWQ